MAKQWKKSKPPLRGAIVAMTPEFLIKDCVIGLDGGLPWNYSEDLKRFKKRTMGCAVIMGRVTWDSLDHKQLPGRRNIVLSRSAVLGVEHYNSIEKALVACGDDDFWFIGGAQIYSAAMPHLNLLDVTYVPHTINNKNAVCFPEIDLESWVISEKSFLTGVPRLRNVIYKRRV